MARRRRYRNFSPAGPAAAGPARGPAPFSTARTGSLLKRLVWVGVFAFFAKDLPNPNEVLAQEFPETTKILARDGSTLLYEIHGEEKRTVIPFALIPSKLKQATLAAEDDDFYTHAGIDIRSIFRAIITDIRTRSIAQGGSTITQQFIKNNLLTPERTLSRKIKEIILSFELERRYNKDDIFWLYLNTIPYGSNAYGVEAAARTYFGKKASELNLAEMALIAALPKAPTFLSPYGSHTDELLARQQYILERMRALGFISDEELAQAQEQKLTFAPQRTSIFAPHFVMYVRELLEERFGRDLVERGGLTVTTTLDPKLQQLAEAVVAEQAQVNEERYGGKNAALVAIDPATGEVLAMVGSRDYFDLENDGNVNVALRPRQPGSALKPFIYAAAFLKGFTPDTILYDVETEFGVEGARSYQPQDYDGRQRGPVSMRSALAQSLNIPAVKTLYLAGLPNVLSLTKAAGITTFNDPGRFGLSLVLGGAEVKLLELTSAYGIFANNGRWAPSQVFKSIKDRQGNILFNMETATEAVLPPEIANTITDILADNDARAPMFGKFNNLTLAGRPAAAKTGTTQDFRDGWIFGYTPTLVTGVWTGNNDNTPMKQGAAGAGTAGPIWNKFMRQALADTPPQNFPSAPEQKTGKPILDGELPATIVKVDRISGKRATPLTPAHLIQEVAFQKAHTILYYVDKDDPLGPVPVRPEQDPQFSQWETAVLEWASRPERSGQYNVEPPEAVDDIHIQENKPRLVISSPRSDALLKSDRVELSLTASAPLGIDSLAVFFDNLYVGTWEKTSDALSFRIPWEKYSNGSHHIRVVARDPVDNETSAGIDVRVLVQEPATAPLATLIQEGDRFPITFLLNIAPSAAASFTEARFYAEHLATQQRFLIGLAQQKSGPKAFRIEWAAPPDIQSGYYQIYAILRDRQGVRLRSTPTELVIAPSIEEEATTTTATSSLP